MDYEKQLAEWRQLYNEKNEHLEKFLERVEPGEFLRERGNTRTAKGTE